MGYTTMRRGDVTKDFVDYKTGYVIRPAGTKDLTDTEYAARFAEARRLASAEAS